MLEPARRSKPVGKKRFEGRLKCSETARTDAKQNQFKGSATLIGDGPEIVIYNKNRVVSMRTSHVAA